MTRSKRPSQKGPSSARPHDAGRGLKEAASALGQTILSDDVLSVLETFHRLNTDEARARFADHFLGRTAGAMDKIWPVFYELLKQVEGQELYKRADHMAGQHTFGSFGEYFEHRVGRPFETWAQMEGTYHYAREYAPELLCRAFGDAQAAMEEAKAARKAAIEANDEVPLPKTGGDRRSEAVTDQTDNISLKSDGHGTSESYLRRRLKRDHPELYERVAADLISAHAAAVQAGIRKRTQSVRMDSPQSAAQTLRKHMPPEARQALARLLLEE